MSKTKFNKNGTVSILGLTKDEYNAITTVIYASQQCFPDKREMESITVMMIFYVLSHRKKKRHWIN